MSKRSVFFVLVFALFLFVSCFEDNSIKKSDIVGEWYSNADTRSVFHEQTLIINNDGSFVRLITRYELNGTEKYIAFQERSEGSIKVKGTRLSMKVSKVQSRMAVGNTPGKVVMSEWKDNTNYSRETKTAEIVFFQNSKALLINKLYYPSYDDEKLTLFLRKGANLTYNKQDLQGTWYTFRKMPVDADPFKETVELFDAVDIAINIKNDSIDMIFNMDGARYVGRYTYDNGVLSTVDSLSLYTCLVLGENMADWKDPYAAPWRESYLGDPDALCQFYKGFTFMFIPEAKTAYCHFGYYTVPFKKQ